MLPTDHRGLVKALPKKLYERARRGEMDGLDYI